MTVSNNILIVSKTSRISRGYLICLAGTAIWSTTGIFIRYLTVTYQIPPLVLAFWRDLSLSIFLVLLFWVVNRSLLHFDRKNLPFFILYGFTVAVFNSVWTFSVALNGAAVATVLAYSSAAFTAVLGRWLFGEILGKAKIIAVTLSLVGCVFVAGAYDVSAWKINPWGILTGLLSGLMFAIYSLMGKASSNKQINPWSALLFSFFIASMFLLLVNFLSAGFEGSLLPYDLGWLGAQWMGWLILLILAVGPTLGGFGLYTVSLSYLPASVANLIATLEPALTAVLAYFFLGEVLSVPQWMGAVLIILSVILLRMTDNLSAVD